MSAITISNNQYHAKPLTAKQFAWYQQVLCEAAKPLDKPLARFIAKLDGVDGEDRKAAIAAFLQRPDWDAPPESLMKQAAKSVNAVILLARMCCEPEPPYADCLLHAGDDPAAFYDKICKAMQPPAPATNEQIIERNKGLRARLAAKNAEKQEPPAGGEPCPPS